MLLANMAKSDSIERLLTLKRDVALGLSASKIAIDQLMDCFVKGAEGSWNLKADFDYLAYLFADLAKVGNCWFPMRLCFSIPRRLLLSDSSSGRISFAFLSLVFVQSYNRGLLIV